MKEMVAYTRRGSAELLQAILASVEAGELTAPKRTVARVLKIVVRVPSLLDLTTSAAIACSSTP